MSGKIKFEVKRRVGKTQPGVADVHASTALGNQRPRAKAKDFLTTLGEVAGGAKIVQIPIASAVAVGKGSTKDGTMTFTFIRHGSTRMNNHDDTSKDRIRGWTNVPLNEDGIKDAEKAGKKLRDSGIKVIVHSDLDRSAQTAKIVNKEGELGAQLVSTPKLRPWDLGDFTGNPTKEAMPKIAAYILEKPDEPVPNGESFNDFRARHFSGIQYAVRKAGRKKLGVVAHYRNERMLSSWDVAGQPADHSIDLDEFTSKGDAPGGILEFSINRKRLFGEQDDDHAVASGDGGADLSALENGREDVGKVWDSNADLPDGVRNVLPEHAQTVFRRVANDRIKAGASEVSAIRQAWTAVKNGWRKEGDQWVRKFAGDDESLIVFTDQQIELAKSNPNHDEMGRFASAPGGGGDVKTAIRSAYSSLAASKTAGWVSLTRLRQSLPSQYGRAEVDQALKEMSRAQEAVLSPDSNQKTLTAADRSAALYMGGEDKHLISIEKLKGEFPLSHGTDINAALHLNPLNAQTARSPFPYNQYFFANLRNDQKERVLAALTDQDSLPVKTVRLSDLSSVQDRIDPNKIQSMLEGEPEKLPVIVRTAPGRLNIADGHHRLTAQMLSGRKTAQVRYMDVEPDVEDVISDDNPGSQQEQKRWRSFSQIFKWAFRKGRPVPIPVKYGEPRVPAKLDSYTRIDKQDGFSRAFEVKKIDEDQQLVFGWASIWTVDGEYVVDKQDDIIPPDEGERAAYDYVLYHRSQGDMHERMGVGRCIESMVFTKQKQDALGIDLGMEAWWIGFKVDEPEIWRLIKSGHRPEFSIGGKATREIADDLSNRYVS